MKRSVHSRNWKDVVNKYCLLLLVFILSSCSKDEETPLPEQPGSGVSSFNFTALKVNDVFNGYSYYGLNDKPVFKVSFSNPIDRTSVPVSVKLSDATGQAIPVSISYLQGDSTLSATPITALKPLGKYFFDVQTNIKSTAGKYLSAPITVNFITALDPGDKFPRLSDEQLLDLVQKQTFKYFWDFGHPVSGMARERNTAGNTVTTGGTGFGVMAIVTAVNRDFITRQQGAARVRQIVDFLKKADRYHGAFSHWMDGNSGETIPFSLKDNGGDLVETALLMQGLLTAKQYFNAENATEKSIAKDIQALYESVEWDWYTKNGNSLFWHWSPEYQWDMNLPIKGWNEALITYVLAAASPMHSISKSVYDQGWAGNGAIRNGNTYFNQVLPLGSSSGGPLFFAQYSFLGLNPNGLKDAYADYGTQVKSHALIQYEYAKANPKAYYGYGENCWGLTASDDINGYLTHEINNDNGVVSPTAALSSFPYTPAESMKALRFFYYQLGDKIWGKYGFTDAFSLHHAWFADSTLAIDQGPMIIMIENYRSQLLWKLFMSNQEVKTGLRKLGFSSPNI